MAAQRGGVRGGICLLAADKAASDEREVWLRQQHKYLTARRDTQRHLCLDLTTIAHHGNLSLKQPGKRESHRLSIFTLNSAAMSLNGRQVCPSTQSFYQLH